MVSGWIAVPVPAYEDYMACPNCRTQVLSNANYCSYCGTMLRPQLILKICPNCKNKIVASFRFCPECGFKQDQVTQAQPNQ